MKLPFLPPLFVPAIALTLIGSVSLPSPGQATTPRQIFSTLHKKVSPSILRQISAPLADNPPPVGTPGGREGGGGLRYAPPRPPDTGAPKGRARGGANRGACPQTTVPLTALVPFTQQESQRNGVPVTDTRVWGLTTAERPTFWFMVPFVRQGGSPTSAALKAPAEFVLQDADGNDLYRTSVELPSQPGVLAVRLPNTVPPLEAGKLYQTYFKVNCSLQRNSRGDYVQAWVQRTAIDPALAKQLAAAKPQARPAIYASNGIWFDALSAIADLRLANPNDATLLSQWKSLLESAQFADVASQPLVK